MLMFVNNNAVSFMQNDGSSFFRETAVNMCACISDSTGILMIIIFTLLFLCN